MFGSRASLKYLAGLCRRLGIELQSGIDLRKTWTRELERAPWSARSRIEEIRLGVSRGDSVAESVGRTGAYFPLLFRRMVEVGEETGHLAEVFRQLADYYEQRIRSRREFLSSISWPMLQFVMALVVIGLLILALGFIEAQTGMRIDILGFGLIGFSGLVVYLLILACIAAVGVVFWQAVRRGALWVGPIQDLVLRLPGLGTALRTLALARLAWTLHLTLEAGMEIRKALALSVRTTNLVHYMRHIDAMTAVISRGDELNEAMAAARVFPGEFVDAVEVGERSGRLTDTLAVLSRDYQDRARAAMSILTRVAGFVVWVFVAIFIVFFILRIATFYVGAFEAATNGVL